MRCFVCGRRMKEGKRWAVEGLFSAVKWCFGETMRARSPEGMVREIRRNFVLYSALM